MEWSSLVEKYGDRVLLVTRSILRDEGLSRDAAQETLVKLVQANGSVRNMDAWVLTVAGNTARDLLRRRRRTEDLEEETVDMNVKTPAEAAIAHETQERLALALEGLPVSDRDILLLKFRENLSGPDIARALGVSLEAAWQRLSRALKALRAKIGESHD